MKKKVSQILESVRDYISNNELENKYKVDVKAFSRKRILDFQSVIFHIIHLLKSSLQIAIREIAPILSIPTVCKQAFCLARKKVLPEAFTKINNKLCSEFYNANEFKTFHGYILLATDGSTMQLPDEAEIIKKYGVTKNHLGKSSISVARASYSYDVMNGITVDAILEKCEIAERELAIRHIQNSFHHFTNKPILYLYDRGYTSLTIMLYHLFNKQNFLIRSTLQFLSTKIQERIKNGEKDFIIELNARKIKGTKKREEFFRLLPNVSIDTRFNVRIIVVELSTGEKEILITSLIDPEFKYEWFKPLYHCRWGAEENYKFHKVRIEIENFSGKSDLVVRQDFHATVFASNIKALIALEAQKELDEENDWSEYKYAYKINQNIAMGALREDLVKMLIDPQRDLESFCNELKKFIKKNTIPIRPERAFPHERKTKGRKYHMTQRRCI